MKVQELEMACEVWSFSFDEDEAAPLHSLLLPQGKPLRGMHSDLDDTILELFTYFDYE